MLRVPISSLCNNWCYSAALPINYQTIRWRRKPRWLPVAKSKIFRVPPRTVTPIEEKLELFRLHNNYKLQIRAIRKYLYTEVQKEIAGDNVSHMSPEEEMEDFVQCNKLNEIWNSEIAKIRDQRLEIDSQKRLQFIQEQIQLQDALKLEQKEKADEAVRTLKGQSKTFITREKIDSAIEQALTNIVDYNFSIDTEGNMYKGRKTETSQKIQSAN